MPLRLLSPGIERLSADGSFTPVAGPETARPVILIARDLCAFERWTPPGGVRAAGAHEAARERARTAAPFLDSGCRVRREGDAFSIWWWDLGRVRGALTARFGAILPAILPWTAALGRGAGWRIVRLDGGYEAQLWEAGVLVASAWSRERFDRRSWSMFTRLQRRAGAPVDPPAPVEAPVALDRVREALIPRPTRQEALSLLAAGVAGVMVLTTAWAAGEGLRHARLTADLPPAAATPAAPSRALAGLAAWREASSGRDPVASSAMALGALEAHGVRPKAWSASREAVRLILPYEALGALDLIAADLQAVGAFRRVQSRTDAAAGEIELILDAAPDGVSPGG